MLHMANCRKLVPLLHKEEVLVQWSVKATSDVNSRVSGKVVGVNEELNSSPGLVSHLISHMHIKVG